MRMNARLGRVVLVTERSLIKGGSGPVEWGRRSSRPRLLDWVGIGVFPGFERKEAHGALSVLTQEVGICTFMEKVPLISCVHSRPAIRGSNHGDKMPSLIFTTVSSLAVVVAVLWHFADAAVHQPSHVGHMHAHTPPMASDFWTLMSHGFR